MKPTGWIKLHRKISAHWLYNEKPFDYFHAWCDLLMEANHETAMRPYHGKVIEQKRGQVVYTVKGLQDRWGWSYRKVRNFLDALERDGMVQLEKHENGNYRGNYRGNLLTIEKYTFYQGDGSNHANYQGNSDAIIKQTTKEEYKNKKRNARARGSSEDPDAALEELEAEGMPDWFKEQIGSVFGKM